MAAANKPTAVHFSLVFFVMVSLILGVTTYLGFKQSSEKEAQLAGKEKELATERQTVSQYRNDTDATKTLLGSQAAVWGSNADDATTVIGTVAAAMTKQGGAQAAPNVIGTLSQMRAALDAAQLEIQSLQRALNENGLKLNAVETGAGAKVNELQTSQASSEQQLQASIAANKQKIDEKNAEIENSKKQANEANVAKGQLQDELDKYRRATEERIALLDKQINFYKDQLDELTKTSFDREDGRIVNVDNTTRTVWLNIGSAEGLRPQVSFSVYTSDNLGIGRGVEDIKGKIEVTRILEPHLAEARILDEDLFRPISDGDPIYSPLWAAGRKEYFAIVGRPDLDEDGKSDWDLFNEIIHTSGAEVELFVNDEGQRQPAEAKLSARTKFLIIGDIDDPAKFSGIPEKQELAEKMQEQQKALIEEARLYGIRWVRLNDFLDYVGWKPEQRLWQPGSNRPFNLQQGVEAATRGGAHTDKSSSGNVSEVFRRNRTKQQQESGGNTSELFNKK